LGDEQQRLDRRRQRVKPVAQFGAHIFNILQLLHAPTPQGLFGSGSTV
jgi:hypothetical protein